MLSDYAPLVIMILVTLALGIAMVLLSFVFGPKRPSRIKEIPYECGITPVGSARERFPVHFFLVAVLFILFDIETIFLYPWAVIYKDAPHVVQGYLLGEMAIFILILLVGYFYLIGRNAFDWSAAPPAAPNPIRMVDEVERRKVVSEVNA